jgi:tRNA A37 threonylcarbamoyladenosine dehydratase
MRLRITKQRDQAQPASAAAARAVRVPRAEPLGAAFAAACRKFRVERPDLVFLYNGAPVPDDAAEYTRDRALVDLDEVCVTNVNRQLHALTSTVGTSKAEALGKRVREINPGCSVRVLQKFFSERTSEEILGVGYSLVLDTIDTAEHKVTLLAECARRGIPAITVGSAGNRTNPTTARVEDLSKTIHDPLLQIVRKKLRQDYEFPRSERTRFDIPCVYAPLQRGPRDSEEKQCATEDPQPRSRAKSCNAGLGSAVFMTGTIGFIAAAEAISLLSQEPPKFPYRWLENRRARLAEPEPA